MNGAPDQAQGDEGLLRHICTNLLSNAVKYSAPGQTVRFAIRSAGTTAECSIEDQGCGIPEADQKRVFQAFHRGSNVRQIPGTGLGLLIVQRCVGLHGGEIEFQSSEGKGTTFVVRLPLFTLSQA
jgi:signal transduction histidine kinase